MKYKIQLLADAMSHKEFRRHCKGLQSWAGLTALGLIERQTKNDSETVLVPGLGGTWAPQQSSSLPDPGALVMDSNGIYRQINFGIVRGVGVLDQDAVNGALSEATTVGPEKNDPDKLIKKLRMLNLDDDSYNTLRNYGTGNLSAGLRAAASVADKAVNDEWVALPNTGIKRLMGINLDDITVAILKRIGFGNMSAGARRAAALVEKG